MTESLAYAASILGLLDRAATLRSLVQGKEEELFRSLDGISFYYSILEEIHQTMLTFGPISPSAEGCLRVCNDTLRDLDRTVSSSPKKYSIAEIEKLSQSFMRSVALLHDIAMIAVMHKLLIQQREFQHSILHMQREQSEAITGLRGLVEQVISQQDKDKQAIEDLSKSVRSAQSQSTPPWGSSLSDGFSFTATILVPHQNGFERTLGRGQLDSGCDDNWVSSELLSRAGLLDQVQELDEKPHYLGFGGESSGAAGIIDLTWRANNSSVTRTTTFFVHSSAPFDMVLGKRFMTQERLFEFNKLALAPLMGKLSKEEFLDIEQNAREKGASDEQIASVRRSADASARERLRRQKAITRSASCLSLTPGTQTPNTTVDRNASGRLSWSGQLLSLQQAPPSPESQISLLDQEPVQTTNKLSGTSASQGFRVLC
ncbi:hypothetical protein VTN00DRAFT_4379 [Thermoascus crustaceus]|uniref:uncharacterized protein n=1 Tax=Thermoascus crustaceus TaxID=5088 RepID=UPI003741F3CC